jgi:hypothetical protein
MADENSHRAAVDLWVEHAVSGLSAAETLANFDEAFGALWRRSVRTLGDVTLMAIADRVLHDAAAKFPLLSQLAVDQNGLRSEQLRAQADALGQMRAMEASRFLLTEFLTVLGSLVADVLTPALHAELAKVTLEQASRRKRTPEDPMQRGTTRVAK